MDEFDQAFAQLKRSPFGEVGANDVFEQSSNMPTVPTSGIEDIGFTPEQLAFIRNGLYNGDFRTPPPEGDGVELDDLTNKLPGWSYVKTGTLVTAAWDDTGSVVFSVAAGGVGTNEAYIEQVVPITAIGRNRVCHIVTVCYDMVDSPDHVLSVEAEYLDADGVATGTSDSELFLETAITPMTQTVVPNGETGAPSDAYFLRVRITVEEVGTSTQTLTIKHVFVEDRLLIPGEVTYETVTAAQTNWGPFPRNQIVVTDDLGGADRTIRGINATGQRDGRVLWVYNMDGSNNLILSHNDGAVATNSRRIYCPNAADLTIRPNGGVMLCWFGGVDGAVKRWRVLSQV